tara:strand:+ start:229 stop:492 length:264 start_codon:yes stop_codon:yes gene_type:complete
MKNLLNKTILKSLQDYKLTNRATNAVLFLPSNQVQEFMRRNGGKLHNYKFETPAQRKAQRIANIAETIAVSTVLIGFCLFVYSFITY